MGVLYVLYMSYMLSYHFHISYKFKVAFFKYYSFNQPPRRTCRGFRFRVAVRIRSSLRGPLGLHSPPHFLPYAFMLYSSPLLFLSVFTILYVRLCVCKLSVVQATSSVSLKHALNLRGNLRGGGCYEWPSHLFLSQQGTHVQSIKKARLSFIASWL